MFESFWSLHFTFEWYVTFELKVVYSRAGGPLEIQENNNQNGALLGFLH